jgi:small subunit ribosomal protein S1
MTDERQNLDSDPSTPAVEPSGEPTNVEPSGEPTNAEPAREQTSAEPAGEQAKAEPAGDQPAEPPSEPAEAEPPAGELASAAQADENASPEPADEQASVEPTGEQAAAVQPAGEGDDAEGTGEQAAGGEDGASPAAEPVAAEQGETLTSAPDAVAPDAVQAAETAALVESAGGAEAEQPTASAESEPAPAPAAAAASTEATFAPAEAAAATTEAAPAPAEAPAADATPEEPEDPALAELREAREKGTPVEGRVIGWNRGGFHVVVGAITAFCPSSEMEVGRPKGPQSYVEKTFPFKVIKYQKKGRRVVLSRAGLLADQRQEVLAGLKPGATLKGRVTSLPDFGAFVDLGGIEGLVHVSEISRSRVQHPKDALQPGQEVEVKVLKIEQGGERISLSMKDLEPDPWQGAGQRFNRGDRFSGKALRRTEFGLFVEIEPEVEGLLHVSQLPPGKSLDDPAYQPGQPIEGWVREIEPKRQRISLSLREVPTDDPWKEIAKRFPEGEMVEGTVESIAPFGVFIALAPGVTGLLPNSQTGLPRGTSAARSFAPGQSARVQVVSVDAKRKRISLGREGTHVEASRNDLQDFKRQEREREKETPTAMAAAFARLRGQRDDEQRDEQ